MEEKIKIYIPDFIHAILLNDMEKFLFFKKNGELNKNAFINTLIVNYIERYQDENNRYDEYIKRNIYETFKTASAVQAEELSNKILSYIQLSSYHLLNSKNDVALSLKPTKETAGTIQFIQDYNLHGQSVSNYFRNMFASYAYLSQDKRERIIFKERFDRIEQAIQEKRKIYFTTPNNNRHIASPYCISGSHEELFNYLLCVANGKIYSFRINRIDHVMILKDSLVIQESQAKLFEKMIQYGPQFAIRSDQEICVHLTENGIKQFHSLYIHRPVAINITQDETGANYYFDCSPEQVYQYFSRFGQDAFIVYPADLRDRMIQQIAKAYRMVHRLNQELEAEKENKSEKISEIKT